MKNFALAGNPNCGKTTLFNSLTGSTAHVGNWPGVTVDKRDGVYKKGKESVAIVDLPGIYSLSPYTPEEVIARNYVLDENPDAIINIIDATNLERNLYLTTQLLETDVPMVIALNMMDEVEKSGDKINVKQLEAELGIPVVAISALKEQGLEELMNKAIEVSSKPRQGKTVLADCALAHLIGDIKIALEGQHVKNPLFHAIKLVENDEIEVKMHPDSVHIVDEFKKEFTNDVFGTDFESLVADARYSYISANYSSALTKAVKDNDKKESKSDRADKVLTNKWAGIPIFLVILFAIFHLTFSENLFFLGGLFSGVTPSFEGTIFEGLFWTDAGINSPGVILQSFVTDITDALSNAVAGALESSPAWVQGFLVDGVLAGVFSVLSFVPQILLLFLFFSILEDSGYMARIAFILDRIFRKFGLSGRAFMPMIMGFGCSVPAMINTRTLADEKERTATVRVIPFFSCGAKLPILVAVAGGIVQQFGVGNADLITYAFYLIGIITAIVTVILMRNTSLKGETPPFIMELPTYHVPQFKNLMIHLWDKLKHFIKKAFTIILASTIVIWFVSHFDWGWHYLEDEQINNSILAGVGKLLQPFFTPVGFGSQLGEWGWVFVVAAITGLIAKENVIATFATLAACVTAGFEADEALEGVDSVVQMIQATGIDIPGLLAFVAFNMVTIPCFAAVATAKAELPSKKAFNGTLIFWLATSYVVAMMIYLIGAYWWTCFIFIAVIAAVVALIIYKNKKDKCKGCKGCQVLDK